MKRATLILLVALGGCGSKSPQEPAAPIDSVQLNAIASSGPTVAEVLAQGNDATPAPAATPVAFEYEGNWATEPALCRRQSWSFSAKTAMTGDASRCAIDAAQAPTDSEVKLTLTCSVAGSAIRTEERWSLVHRDDGSMIVARTAGNSIPRSVTLRRC